MTAELAGLEERRRGAEATFQRIDRLFADLSGAYRRSSSSDAAAAEREQRIAENAALVERQQELTDDARSGAGRWRSRSPSRRRLCASNWPRWRRN